MRESGSELLVTVELNTQMWSTYFTRQRVLGAMGKVKLILLLVDHICEPSPKVRVDKRTILEFEFEACV